MNNLEAIVHLKIHPGGLDGFSAKAAEIVRLTRETDTHTLRCDWFVNHDGIEGEVHELFPNEHGLIEHKMNTMTATVELFTDFAYDHRAALFGEVSQGFVDLATQRMGAPTVFSFIQGLDTPPSEQSAGGDALEVIARISISPGQLEGFRSQVAELLRLVRDQDTQTTRYDWFINTDGTECEVHEAYRSEQGLVQHNEHIRAAREILFRDFAFDHRMSVYGRISTQLQDLFRKHAGGVGEFTLLEGLEQQRGRVLR